MMMEKKRNADLTERAQKLRTHATEQENRLWYTFLRKYPVQFRRQVTMNQFIVDFFCARANLILEIDGSQHYEEQGLAYDAERTAILESFGYKVLRFTNDEVNYNFHSVCDTIDREVQARINAAKQQK